MTEQRDELARSRSVNGSTRKVAVVVDTRGSGGGERAKFIRELIGLSKESVA